MDGIHERIMQWALKNGHRPVCKEHAILLSSLDIAKQMELGQKSMSILKWALCIDGGLAKKARLEP